MQAKAIACERPAEREAPLSRYALGDIVLILKAEGIVTSSSRSTLCRWYKQDALKPWALSQLAFPARDTRFLEKASVVLDLYHGNWAGEALGPDDYVLSADEKCGLQILSRCTVQCGLHWVTNSGPC